MKYKVFVDGGEGTTGLKIFDRLSGREDIEILRIREELRKDIAERKKLINMADYVFLCLPDSAAVESSQLLDNDHTKIIDASTAHRTTDGWAYGFPELSSAHRQKIASSQKVAVPGCYASGFISLVYPMVASGIMSPDQAVYCHAVSGYSGAGKKAIAVYESADKPHSFESPRQYALTQCHKHLPEMQKIAGLNHPPMFNPIVDDYFSGMVVSVPVITRTLAKKISLQEVHKMFCQHYAGQRFVKVMPLQGEGVLENGFLSANDLAGTNDMQIFVCGNDERILLASRFDNLGKGASGAAVQCMNIMMGIDEGTSLD